jgi:hypothetical protein
VNIPFFNFPAGESKSGGKRLVEGTGAQVEGTGAQSE